VNRPSCLRGLKLLWRDRFAFAAALFLIVVVGCALAGPALLDGQANGMNLRMRNAPPFSLENGWLFFLGADTLGRSLLARIIVAAQTTLAVAAGATLLAMTVGTILGLQAGLRRGQVSGIVLRIADMIMSFPSLLLALAVLYVLPPHIINVMLVLAITRIPVFIRTVRAEVLEIRERMFVTAARVLGASEKRIIFRHLLPVVLPTLLTISTLEFGYMMLTEAGLSFLGLGVQPPDITWGLMVANGKNYLSTAWWLAFWPGLAIMLTTISLTVLSNWLSMVADPRQRWRLEGVVAGEALEADSGEAIDGR
jgi:peptide/nickel transport system permease protein